MTGLAGTEHGLFRSWMATAATQVFMNDTLSQVARDTVQWHTQLPWLMLGIVALPMLLSAWRLKIYPSVWWAVLLGISVMASVVTVFAPSMLIVTLLIDLVVGMFARIDFLRALPVSRKAGETVVYFFKTGMSYRYLIHTRTVPIETDRLEVYIRTMLHWLML